MARGRRGCRGNPHRPASARRYRRWWSHPLSPRPSASSRTPCSQRSGSSLSVLGKDGDLGIEPGGIGDREGHAGRVALHDVRLDVVEDIHFVPCRCAGRCRAIPCAMRMPFSSHQPVEPPPRDAPAVGVAIGQALGDFAAGFDALGVGMNDVAHQLGIAAVAGGAVDLEQGIARVKCRCRARRACSACWPSRRPRASRRVGRVRCSSAARNRRRRSTWREGWRAGGISPATACRRSFRIAPSARSSSRRRFRSRRSA